MPRAWPAVRTRRAALTGLLLTATSLAPLLGSAAEILVVTQKGRGFDVRDATVARGTLVRFTNEDEFPHQIRIRGPELDVESGLQATGETVDVLLAEAGLFDVRCGIHPRMRLTVTAR